MEGYYIIYINDILIIFSFKGRYFLLSYNGKFEKYPPYPPLRVSEGEFGILLGRLFAGGIRLFRFSRQQVLYLFGSALHHHPIVCVGGLYLPEAQLAHGTAHLLETQPQRGVAETTDDLAAGGIDSPFVTRNFAASLFRNIKYFTLRKLYLCRKWMQKRLQKTTTTGITLPNFDFLA